jgi:hypothetical protein
MAVTARFKVNRITPGVAGDGTAEVEMTPDYAQGKNAAWAAATPSGLIRMTIGNPDALKHFEGTKEGKASYDSKPVHVTFEFPEE